MSLQQINVQFLNQVSLKLYKILLNLFSNTSHQALLKFVNVISAYLETLYLKLITDLENKCFEYLDNKWLNKFLIVFNGDK